jgi:hypothetical protein
MHKIVAMTLYVGTTIQVDLEITSVNANESVVMENIISPAVMTTYWGSCHNMWRLL